MTINHQTSLLLLLVLGFLVSSSAVARNCQPTTTMPSGTHYEPVTRESKDIGKGLLVMGRVLEAGTCKPVASAKVSHWQAGKDGSYTDRLRAYLFTNQQGEFRFNTEWPAANIPHIHFIVESDKHEKLTTQWVGDETRNEIRFDIVLERKN